MKTREIILLTLLVLGGVTVALVGWRLLAPARPSDEPSKNADAASSSKITGSTRKQRDSEKGKQLTTADQTPAAESGAAAPEVSFSSAAQIALSEPDRGKRYKALMELVGKLDLSQIRGALDFANTLEGRDRESMIRFVSGRWGSLDPMSAIAYAQTIGDKNLADRARESAVIGWTNTKPVEALAWINGLPAGDDRSQLLTDSMGWWAMRDPQAAANYLNTLQNPGDQAAAASRLAGTWSFRDHDAALQWANSQTDENVRGSAYRGMMYGWARQDAPGASTWLQSLPQGVARDQAVSGFSRVVGYSDPTTALTWAETISDPQTRASVEVPIVTSWMRRDKSAAEQWVAQTSTLGPEAKALITNPANNGANDFGGGRGSSFRKGSR